MNRIIAFKSEIIQFFYVVIEDVMELRRFVYNRRNIEEIFNAENTEN